jgi:phospholipid N-methyltransferase
MLSDKVRAQLLFFRQMMRATGQVGAFSATTRAVAEAVAAPIRRGERPLRVLEVGAGTGSLTEAVYERLGPQDRLDLVEINPAFAAHLRRAFTGQPGGPTVQVLERDVEALDPAARWDVIVSSLPLLNMPPEKVERVFALYLERLEPHGQLVYYDYWAKALRTLVTPAAHKRRRMERVLRVTRRFQERHEVGRKVVLLNFPPALVHYLRPAG